MYFLAQFLGGFLASGVVYINYINGINAVEGHGIRTVPPSPTATAGIFCTYPQAFMTKASMFFDEFIASAMLMFVIFALKDDSNKGQFSASGAWFPLGLFFLIFGIGATWGWQTGYAINFARDFGPRLMSYAVGYGHEVWSAGGYYFWIPMVAPFLGCLFGGFLYDVFIYTGPSPINTPYMGLGKLFRPKEAIKERLEVQKKEGLV
jgi:aquaglyceroporin related protein